MKQSLVFICACFVHVILHAQNVGIGTTTPHASAALDITSANKGVLLPRNANPTGNVPTPAAGLLLYNTTTNQPNYYNGSLWQPLGNLSQQFQRAMAFPGTLYSAAPATVDFVWLVPEGVTSIWIEMWAGGDAGTEIPADATSELSNLSGSGGDAADYLSILLPVTPGSNISMNVGKGGTKSFPSGGSSAITYGSAKYTVNQAASLLSYTVSNVATSPVPHVLAFAGGQQGKSPTQSFQQTGTSSFRRVISGGCGGDTFNGGRGGDGRTVSYDMSTGTPFPSGLLNVTGYNGSIPGGGGGSGFGAPGNGGPGLVIIHY